ncbi:MAG: polysaccharide pyruvyl transferase family protein [Thermodesulfobacteriota bacterium]
MKRICIWGTALRKVADEAQVIAFIRIMKNRIPDARITLFSRYGELMAELMAKENLEIETIRTAHIGRVIQALAHSDIFVLEGGPFYEDPLQALRCLILFSIAKIFRRPVIAYGVTAFHFKTWWGRFLFRNMFDRMDAIKVREKTALNIIKDLGVKKDVTLFADPRFILEPTLFDEVQGFLFKEGINVEEPFIGITTRYLHQNVPAWVKRSHYYTDERVENANEVIARVAAYLSELAQVIIIPMHPSYAEDIEMANVMKKYIPNPSCLKMLSRRYSALEMMGIISQCELLLAARLGSAVFATVAGTPIVAIAYEPRMVDHMERVGLGKYVFDWKNLKYDDLVAKVKEIWLSRDIIKEHMKSQVKEFKEMAWKNAEIVNKFM